MDVNMDADDSHQSTLNQLNPLKRSFVEALRGFSNSQPLAPFTPDPKRRNQEAVETDTIRIEVSKVLVLALA
jgi:hypothetical protein